MPTRKDKFVNGGIYHIYNKTIEPFKIFTEPIVNLEFINSFIYYRSYKSNPRYSLFKKMEDKIQLSKMKAILNYSSFLVDIIAFCLMPNHYHFLLKQKKKNGIIRFTSNIINSITRFYNQKNNRKGPLFLPRFQSRKILGLEEVIYLSKYIHLNPFNPGFIKNERELIQYPYSSLKSYLSIKNKINNNLLINTDFVLSRFNYKRKNYLEYLFDERLNNNEDIHQTDLTQTIKRIR